MDLCWRLRMAMPKSANGKILGPKTQPPTARFPRLKAGRITRTFCAYSTALRPVFTNSGRHPQVLLNDSHEVAFQIPVFHAIIVAIANQQERLPQSSVECNSMTCVEFSLFRTRPTKRFYKLTRAIELEQVIRSIAISNE